MKTIQITIDPELLQLIDKESGSRKRSAFFRNAAQAWLKQLHVRKLEWKHRDGYAKNPVQPDEFDKWEHEQVWPK